jgi:NAD(P)H dehydrogenase (quinone)
MPIPSLAITGSSGYVGGSIARQLAGRGVPLRLLVRNPDTAPDLPGAVVVASAYADDDATRKALDGVDVLFMVSGAESADRLEQHRAFIDAAGATGVRHIVYTSFYGAAPDATFTLARDHWETEQHILRSGITHTFLRDNLYIDFLPSLVGEDGVLRGPAADGRVAAVTRADVARVAAVALQDPAAHANVTYDLTGPEALTMEEVARILTERSGRTVTFHDETLEEAYESRRRWPAPQWQYDAWVSTYTAIAAGELAAVADDVRRVTGRAAESFSDYLDRTP